MPIHILEESVIAQIAAGEVVERPSSVVKELLENALDAGATNVRIAVHGDGSKRIQISDNGSGIPADEVELAFARHATSKLRSADDLYAIQTLGFRGEALASIASVSHLTMTTRAEAEPIGTLIRLEGGLIHSRRSIGAPPGTLISVENLFYNTPARLKFLKKETTEKRQIATVITRYAMAYPHVRFLLEQDGHEIFRTGGSGDLIDVILVALGLDQIKHMLEVDDTQNDIRVHGFASMPGLNRADRTRITLFVNGRWIQDTSLTYAVVQAYHTLLMTGRYPVAVLMIEMPPADVDVNVHPTKAEVRFRDPDAVFSAVQRAVRRAVIDQAQTPALRIGRYAAFRRNEDDVIAERQLGLGLALEAPGQHARQQQEAYDPTAIPEGAGTPDKPRTLLMLRVVGQIGAAYIVAEGPAGMYLIDQHAAHERILFEQFMAEHARQQPIKQYTLAAQTIQVAPAEARVLEEHLDALTESGFGIEPFGPNVFIIRSLPAMLADSDPVEVIGGIIEDLERGDKPGAQSVEDKIVLRVCKQAAVKAGQVLSYEQMQAIIRQLERCETPLTCPHGRPTMIHLSSDRLAREFGRLGS